MNNEKRRLLTLLILIVAGETVFFLPFVMTRIFRPTLLEVFQISNVEIGSYFSVYGVVAMISYIFGGSLADRFPARNLMAFALWLTSIGGFVMTFIPSGVVMMVIYGFWGFTSIFLFWAAMIRATREWGGTGFQGRAFGWLEGGRGATAAIMGTLSFILFSMILTDANTPLVTEGPHAFQFVILSVSIFTFLNGFLVWRFIPGGIVNGTAESVKVTVQKIGRLIRMPSMWLLALIIVSAYAGYKITDDFSLFAREVLGFSEIDSAGLGTAALWLRAGTAVLAGIMADRFDKMKVIILCFTLTLIGGLVTAVGMINHITVLILLNLVITAAGIYGVRALYFAILKEAGIAMALTGTAVGIVSFVGYTPDVFMSPWMGFLLDRKPGAPGHQDLFLVLSIFALAGLLSTLLLKRITNSTA